MTDLPERIEALEKWRELYRAWKETEWVDESDAMAYADVLADAGDELATALEQAQAENERMYKEYGEVAGRAQSAEEKLEQAEAKAAGWRTCAEQWRDKACELNDKLEQAEARIAMLKEECGFAWNAATMHRTIGAARLRLAETTARMYRAVAQQAEAALAATTWQRDYQAGVTRLMAACLTAERGKSCATDEAGDA